MSEKKSKNTAWGLALAWLLLLGLLALVAAQLRNSLRGMLARGEKAPSFTLTTFDEQTIDSADFAGKVVLINIWASWCKPCEQEAHFLAQAWEQYAGRGDVLFLGIDYVDTDKEAIAYLNKFGITYPNGPDLGTSILHTFSAQGVPDLCDQ